MKVKNWLLIIFSASLLTSCATVPYTGRSRVMLTSPEDENKMGEQAWKEISKKEKITTNKLYTDRVNRIGKRIAEASGQDDFKWEFKVFESEQANAFCLPGGKVAVYTGLFKFTSNDAELATVVGHEVAHAILRHGGERTGHGLIQQVGAELITASEVDSAWLTAYGIAANLGAVLPYSREHEYEADQVGIIFMAKAGYDPKASITFWKKFGKLSKQSSIEEFFSTHPVGDKRIDELKARMQDAWKTYQNAPNQYGLGEVYNSDSQQ